MSTAWLVLELVRGRKTYAAAAVAIVSGLGMILSKNSSEGLSQIFEGLLVIAGGAGMASLRHAVAQVEAMAAASKGGGDPPEVPATPPSAEAAGA